MSYPELYRKRVLEYRNQGHTLEETHKVFNVAVVTIYDWQRKLKRQGNLKDELPKRSFKKINPEKLKAYVAEYPDKYLREIAAEFHCCQESVRKALKRLKITRKKRLRVTKNKILNKSMNT